MILLLVAYQSIVRYVLLKNYLHILSLVCYSCLKHKACFIISPTLNCLCVTGFPKCFI
jgi:hypothetical protein